MKELIDYIAESILSFLKSRKNRLMLLDIAMVLILYFFGKYGSPSLFDDIQVVIIALQPIFGVNIAAIAYEDGQKAKALGENYPAYLNLFE